ncbi:MULTISPECIES: hypothetical protein [unclassified Nonomuraea]
MTPEQEQELAERLAALNQLDSAMAEALQDGDGDVGDDADNR